MKMKQMKKGIAWILCALLATAAVPDMQASDSLQPGDTVYFGKYFSVSYYPYELDPNTEFTVLGIPNFMNNDEFKMEVAEVNGQYYARTTTRGFVDVYRNVPLSWRVLHVENGKAFLITDHAVQQTAMHSNGQDQITWETSALRSFLNGYGSENNAAQIDFHKYNFLNIAFDDYEQKLLLSHTTGASGVQDKIFIPSKQELTDYFPDENARMHDLSKMNGFAIGGSYFLRDSQNGTFSYLRGDGKIMDGAYTYNRNSCIVVCATVDLTQAKLTPLAGESPTYSITLKDEQNNNSSDANDTTSAQFPFVDVKPEDWEYDSVRLAYENNLMQGVSAQKFDPNGKLTIAQAITMAARTHHNFHQSQESFKVQEPWYQAYVDYAINQRIINKDDFKDYSRTITRAEMAYIFANTLPESEYEEINQLTKLPDVNDTTPYTESIFKLFRAGVLQGNQYRSFSPNLYIHRSEVAAIVVRLLKPEMRITFQK